MTEISKTPGVTEDLCRWIHGLKLEDIPEDICIRAKHLLLDGISCAVVGAHVPWSEKATQSIQAFEPTGQATVLGHEWVNFSFSTRHDPASTRKQSESFHRNWAHLPQLF